jgi:acyl-CoA dehydrogenase
MSLNLGLNPAHAPLLARVKEMIQTEIIPLEEAYQAEISKGDRWTYTERQSEILEGLKAKAKAAGLWNFWLTESDKGLGLTTVDYAYFAEEMGRTPLGAEVQLLGAGHGQYGSFRALWHGSDEG